VLYGHPPRHLGISDIKACSVADLEAWLTERELITKLIQQQLLRAQQRMKAHADKHRSKRVFQEGDQVYLKLQPYVQSSLAARDNQKLSFRYYGPFTVLQRIGQVAYKLDLPETARIHPVVHVSQLKRHVAPSVVVSSDLSSVCTDPLLPLVPAAILDRRCITRGASTVSQLKIKWDSLPSTLGGRT